MILALCAAGWGEDLKLELLRLATLLIHRAPALLAEHRKELIKFGWNHLKRNDSPAKHHAFLNICRFLDAYAAPDKIVLQASPGCTCRCSWWSTASAGTTWALTAPPGTVPCSTSADP